MAKSYIKKPLTLTIGIPAFNEQENIALILEDLIQQKIHNATVTNIFVLSDASTDDMHAIVKKFSKKHPSVILKINKERIGKGKIQNIFFDLCRSDIAVIIDGDTRLKNKDFIQKLITPILLGADLTSARVMEDEPLNFFQNFLKISMDIKRAIFEDWDQGNNIYTCHGRSRAFSKKLYSKLRFFDSIGEDAYSYLFCLQHNMKYVFVPQAQVYYTLPGTYQDHKKQSVRFFQSTVSYISNFPNQLVEKAYELPKSLILKHALSYLIRKPFLVIGYGLIMGSIKLSLPAKVTNRDAWDIATSSK